MESIEVKAGATLIPPERWVPNGVDALEPTAEEVVRGDGSFAVIAGPGAGKTELLAQKAAFLLQTGKCPSPRRILAISFKKDAAKNLGERINKRCRPDQAIRFDSMTFDAYAKGLLDRFRPALHQYWRPTPDYAIHFPKRDDWNAFLSTSIPPQQYFSRNALRSIKSNNFGNMISSV
ncbi:MAG: UvrD-helicase domain-containing protein [Magnetococcales bacterium]|nr:UvrD-helicase domain-containing protein [Magnetococcales bacterium]